MQIGQMDINGKDRYQAAIERLQAFEPTEGYYLAFSGGKDSEVIKQLAIEAGVKYDVHYNLTTVDPPELVNHIREHHKDVQIHYPELTMWRLIEKKMMPPTRMVRYCCDVLKEGGGEGRVVVTGVRRAESSKRANRDDVEIFSKSKSKKMEEQRRKFYEADPEQQRNMMESCPTNGKYIVNPIIDWLDEDVWQFIRERKIKYCTLYDEGFERLGCVGCPLAGRKQMAADFDRWPQYKKNYIKAFMRMIENRHKNGKETEWKTGEDVFEWWSKY